MVKEAEEFADEDKKSKDKVDARNGLEGYCYNLKNQLEDEEKGIANKLGDEDKDALTEAVNAALEWLESNQDAEAEEYKDKLKEVEKVSNPIMAKVYGAGGAPGGAPGGGEEGGDDFGAEL